MTDSIVALRNKTILFAEDDNTARAVTKDSLDMLFKKVIVAKDGQEALEKYADQKPDMILTDIKMPNMDGLEFIAEVRKHDLNTPIILFTAHSEQRYLVKAINLLIDGIVVKPVKLDNMLEVFAKCGKRLGELKPTVIEFDDNTIYYAATNELYNNGRKATLGAKELGVLKILVNSYPNIVTKQEISDAVWTMEEIGESTIKNVVSRLRAKIGHNHILASTGIGWRLQL
ncbi:MAG: hypothetical protein RL154_8 [Pseudomonadota bacterium]|jgi:DNA-binding response OmpR family regulator